MGAETISVSVVYALAERQEIVKLAIAEGTTVAQAVAQSELSRRFPEINSRPLHCAIYSRAVDASYVVRDGDRIEILRPLLIDPKEQRRQAAAKNKLTR
jgi:putative ubiquitin-RnfH superfamily antitoxin RatB of RatAB toxin-antitoxin module